MDAAIKGETKRSNAGRRKAAAPPLPKIVPVEGISIERQVYGALRYALMSGAIRPGAGLTSRSLSEALGVSGTPVREALKRLDSDGALVSRNKSAFFVYDPDRTDFAELFQIRLALEGLAIRKAAERIEPADMAHLKRTNDKYQKVLKSKEPFVTESTQLNFQFHFEVYKLCGSTLAVEMIETLWLRVGPTLQRYMPAQGDGKVLTFHDEMLDALLRNHPEDAYAALESDLTTAYEWIMPRLRERSV